MNKTKNPAASGHASTSEPAAKNLQEGRERLAETQKKTVSGLWPLLFLLGLLLLVVIMHWFRTN